MAQTSPSEFLTFYRTLKAASTFRPAASRCLARPAAPVRGFHASTTRLAGDIGPNKTHTVDKGASGGDPNVQSQASHQGRKQKATDEGGAATRERDERKSSETAKKEHPEAPDTVIGMQDERGGKGL